MLLMFSVVLQCDWSLRCQTKAPAAGKATTAVTFNFSLVNDLRGATIEGLNLLNNTYW
jgi:hypothetical protein